MQCTGSAMNRRLGIGRPSKTMQYEYSLHYNDVQRTWQVNWVCFDPDRPHQMKGDIAICRSFDEAIESIRGFVAQLDPDRLDDIV